LQIVKYTGWSLDQIYEHDIKTISFLAKWAYNQEIIERENLFAIMQWHLGAQHKKSAKTSKKNLKKALKKQSYNPPKDKTEDWNKFFRSANPKAFDKFYNSLKAMNNS
jgi:hypothetical protein